MSRQASGADRGKGKRVKATRGGKGQEMKYMKKLGVGRRGWQPLRATRREGKWEGMVGTHYGVGSWLDLEPSGSN